MLLLSLRLQAASLINFVYQHTVQRTDTLQMLAVRHNTDVPSLKRLNNIISEHSLHSRTNIFIPGQGTTSSCGMFQKADIFVGKCLVPRLLPEIAVVGRMFAV